MGIDPADLNDLHFLHGHFNLVALSNGHEYSVPWLAELRVISFNFPKNYRDSSSV
jgi:hypothetical protein